MNVTIKQYPFLYAATKVPMSSGAFEGIEVEGVGSRIFQDLTGEQVQKRWDIWEGFPNDFLINEVRQRLGDWNIKVAYGIVQVYLYAPNDEIKGSFKIIIPERLWKYAVNPLESDNKQYPFLRIETKIPIGGKSKRRWGSNVTPSASNTVRGAYIFENLSEEEVASKWNNWLSRTDNNPQDLVDEILAKIGQPEIDYVNGLVQVYLYGVDDMLLDSFELNLPYDPNGSVWLKELRKPKKYVAENEELDSPPTLAIAAPEVENIDGSVLSNSNYFKINPSAILGNVVLENNRFKELVPIVKGTVEDAVERLPKQQGRTLIDLLHDKNNKVVAEQKEMNNPTTNSNYSSHAVDLMLITSEVIQHKDFIEKFAHNKDIQNRAIALYEVVKDVIYQHRREMPEFYKLYVEDNKFRLHVINSIVETAKASGIGYYPEKSLKTNLTKGQPSLKTMEAKQMDAVIQALDTIPSDNQPKKELSQIVPFSEAVQLLNAHLEEDDIVAYLYYKNSIGDAWEGKWKQTKYYRLAENLSTKQLKKWCQSRTLVYDGTSYSPSFIFYSGNLLEKLEAIETHREIIAELLGLSYYESVVDTLKQVAPKPLTINAKNESDRLYIGVHHDLVSTIYVISPADKERLDSGELMKVQDLIPWKMAFRQWMAEQPLPPGTNSWDINEFFLEGKMPKFDKDDTANEKQNKIAVKQLNVKAGEELWLNYLTKGLHEADQKRIEDKFNTIYNNYVPLNTSKIPVGFEYAREFKKGVQTDIREEKREAIAFMANEGSTILAYDVGVGKTWSAIFTIAHNMDNGYCKRPVIITPTSVYNQFTKELKELLPHIKVNEFGNLGSSFIDKVTDSNGDARRVEAGTITIITIEALKKLGLTRDGAGELSETFFEILNQGIADERSSRDVADFQETIDKMVGKVQSESMLFVDDFGWDFAVVDEAHSMKNLFTNVKGKVNENTERRESAKYHTGGKKASIRALKGFCVLNYIQAKNKARNVLLMTATPFTNSPLEIFSMLSLVAYYKLKKDYKLPNAHEFYSTFADVSYELVVKAGNNLDYAEVVKGFHNLRILSSIIRRFLLYKTGEDVGLVRPNKVVLPLRTKMIGDRLVKLNDDEAISTLLKPSELQAKMFEEIDNYLTTGVGLRLVCDPFEDEGFEPNSTISEGEKGKGGVKVLRSISFYKKIILSPYMLFEDCGIPLPSAKVLVENSPKLMYTMMCIKSVKEHHEKQKTMIAGQVIYLNMGSEILPLLKSYLVEEIGFAQNEVDFITGATSSDKRDSVKNAFNDGKVKIIIGSSAMKEGMNLQTRGAVLYNLTLDWNPTDIKQLEGRIWRQGNQFNNVRMVLPMIADSSDSFILQKLDEKTARINEIFSTSGKTNTLKLDELNPEEIKYELITDPKKRAQAEINDVKFALEMEQKGVISSLTKLEEHIKEFVAPSDDLELMIQAIKHVEPEYEPKEDITIEKAIGKFSRMKTQAMKEPDAKEYEVANKFHPRATYFSEDKFEFSITQFQRIRDNVKKAKLLAAIYNKGEKVTLQFLLDKSAELGDSVLKVNRKINEFDYLKRVAERTQELELLRESTKGSVGLPQEQALKFATLNYLLDDLRVTTSKPKVVEPVLKNAPLLEPQKCPPLDNKGIPLVDAASIEQLERCIASLTPTKAMHTNEAGRYTVERLKLHSKIIDHFTAIRPCRSEQPIAILTGGLPGAGKSTFIKKSGYNWMLDSELVYHIDADEVREFIPEYKGWNANQTHAEVKDIVKDMFDKIGKPCRHHLLYDGTMKSYKEYYALIDRLLGLGFKVYIIFILIDGETAKKRVLQRYQHGNGKFHRYVPQYLVDNNSGMGRKPLDELRDKVSGYVLVDGINQEVLEKGGEDIPIAVSQFDAPTKKENSQDVVASKTTIKAETKKRIEGLKMVLKYGAEGHDIAAVRLRLKSLQTTLNYI